MTYRERRLARAERLREWAEKREAKANAAQERVHQIADMIPFGQPILVGHHSERGHRRDVARIESGMAATVEHSRKAASMSSRAETIEAQTEHAIYSDDPDAPERLEERIADLEAERDRVKAYNASCRRGAPDASLLDERQRRDVENTARAAPYMLGKGGAAPAYVLSNLSANINRQKKRLAEIRATANAPTASTFRMMLARYDGTCDGCGATVKSGDVIHYSRREREVRCETCGGAA